MAVKIVTENLLQDGDTDLDKSMYFSIENYGTVDVELYFDSSGIRVQLPNGTKREFPFVGDRYEGKMYVRFKKLDATNVNNAQVTILKLTHNC